VGKSKPPAEKDRYSKPKSRLVTRTEQAKAQFEEDEKARAKAKQRPSHEPFEADDI
jgi:hypothetical protein